MRYGNNGDPCGGSEPEPAFVIVWIWTGDMPCEERDVSRFGTEIVLPEGSHRGGRTGARELIFPGESKSPRSRALRKIGVASRGIG